MKSKFKFNMLTGGKEEKAQGTFKIPYSLASINNNTSMATRNAKSPPLYRIVFYLPSTETGKI
jgi:hypothetical protein